MIYITENSKKVEFPRTSKMIVDKLVITNQTTKQEVIVPTDDDYSVDLSSIIDWFAVCQYDYQFKYQDTVISSGILQYGDYTPDKEIYDNKPNIIQYTP